MSSKRLKALLLLSLLGMPVLFYLFLQSFGENRYSLPVYFQSGIEHPMPDCAKSSTAHNIKSFIQQDHCEIWDCSRVDGKYFIINYLRSDCGTEALNPLARACNNFRDEPMFNAITLAGDSLVNPDLVNQQLQLYNLPPEIWSWWHYQNGTDQLVKCGINLDTDCATTRQLVLIDKKYQIRGFYDATDEKDVDRLITEYRILLNESG